MNSKSYRFDVSFDSHVGRVRERNEDFVLAQKFPEYSLNVLCDGMGGAAGGQIASKMAAECILEYFSNNSGKSIPVLLQKSIEFANEQIYLRAQSEPELRGMGTTCVVVIISDNEVHYAHVGDSRLYKVCQGELVQITEDHSYVNELVKQGLISKLEALKHPEKNRILRALGVNLSVDVEVCRDPIKLYKGEALLLCSDGLSDMVSDNSILEILSDKVYKTGQLKCDALIQGALKGGGKDNISVFYIEFNQSPFRRSFKWRLRQNLIPIVIFLIVFVITLTISLGYKLGWQHNIFSPKEDTVGVPHDSIKVEKDSILMDSTRIKVSVDTSKVKE